ncbi:MAG: L,D-transpeptidase [Bergeyella sp.]
MTMKTVRLMLAFLLLNFLVYCKKDRTENFQNPGKNAEDFLKNQQIKEEKKKPEIRYSDFIFPEDKRDSMMAVFNETYSEQERYTILALNRLDSKNKWRADTLMIPDKIDSTLMSYSPFPYKIDVLKDVKKIALFSYPVQAYGVYSSGKLQKWGPTSMGKKSAETKRGLMFANWKKELAISTINKSWKLPYNFNLHNTLGIGWHQYDLPGFPASHSCLRLLMDDAKWMYGYADQWILNKDGATVHAKGTPVIVFGDFDWNGKKPWKKLSSNPKANDISEAEMNEIIRPFLDEILKEQKNREDVLSQINAEKMN